MLLVQTYEFLEVLSIHGCTFRKAPCSHFTAVVFNHLSLPSCSGGSLRHQIQLDLYSPCSVSQAFSEQVALDIRALTFSHLMGMNSAKSRHCMKPLSCPVDPSEVL